MNNKPNKKTFFNENVRNIIITFLLIIIFGFVLVILYFLLFSKEEKIANRTPYLEIYGDNPLLIETNSEYAEKGYYAYDLEDGDLTAKVVVKNNIDVRKSGVYEIEYSVADKAGVSNILTRTVIVAEDSNDFKVNLKGKKAILFKKGNNYTEQGYSAIYNGTNVSDKVKIYTSLDTSKEGIYDIYYVCENNSRIAATTRKIIVSNDLTESYLDEVGMKKVTNFIHDNLFKNFKLKKENLTSPSLLYLAFANCENNGTFTKEALSSCLTENLKLNDISTETYYEYGNSKIYFDKITNIWKTNKVEFDKYMNSKETEFTDNLFSIGINQEKVEFIVEKNDLIYRIAFEKVNDTYSFVSSERI